MRYELTKPERGNFKRANLRTADAQVIEATPSFDWSIGKQIDLVLGWATRHGFTYKILEDKQP